tara:strand:+ start:72 stop:293 length:222 start_codon:yes stop_codon:yes gene_type:complete
MKRSGAETEMKETLDLLEAQMYEAFKSVRALHTSPMGKCDYDPEEFYVDVQDRLSKLVAQYIEGGIRPADTEK